ncbi:hypothetical protein DJ021_10420 [Phenylobacterium hankyongense]|uniref:DUF4386 domain-containing protein n=1 Tax=Phenylobacterium hankyongense TaxID=1813876 RepID=A0A328B0U4_9CAUL|nr:DUF4386 domain-containing protein [Phenylobacterium hankyongense]RAK60185.1 hypothetical protein DJ021_10420 [Phenylobacterium hankyongense]
MRDATVGAASRPGPPVQPSQRTAAQIAGAILLLAMASSIFAEFVGLGAIEISDDVGATARSIVASEQLVRIAAVTDLVCFVSDVAIAAALYVVLRPINRGLAAFGAFLRVADAVVLAMSTVALFAALRLLGGAPYLQSFDVEQLQTLARLLLGVRADTMSFGWVFLGLGQAVFAWLWLKSGYIPKLLAAWGIFASSLLALVPLALMVLPQIRGAVGMLYMAPMFFYEVPLGIWLLVKGIREVR